MTSVLPPSSKRDDPLDSLLDPLLDASFKGFPHATVPLRRSAVGQQGWNVLCGDLPFPVAVIRAEALNANVSWMQGFARAQGLEMAPHGKTTMSPQLFRRQLDAGAWGMTVANVTQLQAALAAGARNCLIANQVFAANDLAQIDRLLRLDRLHRVQPGLRIVFLVDSLAQLACIDRWHTDAKRSGEPEPLEVLLEVGVPGGRTGCRDHAQAMALAQAVKASPAVRLVGLECYEGLGATGQSEADQAYASALMKRLNAVALECDALGLFEADEVLMSAGGSGIFDLVAPHLKPVLNHTMGRPVRGLLRSGCYITHDQGSYKRLVSAVTTRLGCGDGLHAALEVWAAVQSVPESGLAILTVGKRDISYDQEMPTVLRYSPMIGRQQLAAPPTWRISAMNDQHAYLRWPTDVPSPLRAPCPLYVGDRVCLGISHPCTTFDKWRWMPLVDEDCNVIDAITTCF